LCSTSFFENRAVYETRKKKHFTAERAVHRWEAHCTLDTKGHKHTQTICNTCSFSTAVMVGRTPLNFVTRTLPVLLQPRWSVYCAVRTGYFNSGQFWCLKGPTMSEGVSHRPLIKEAWVQSQVSPCQICGGQSGTGTVFSPSAAVSPCHCNFACCCVLV